MSSRASKKIEIDDQKKNLNEKKKSFVWMFRIDLKKTNYCDKKQKTVYSSERFRKSLRSFNEKKKKEKEITTSDSRAAISSSAPPKWRKTTKKNRNRKRFSCFFNNTTKGRTFQFLMTISMPARPPIPFKPLRMNVNRHYYIKTKKAGKN